jgi:glycosyltransferase involved in cell wall biosynthesis
LQKDLIVVDPANRVAELAPAFDVFWLSSNLRSEGVSTVVGDAMPVQVPVVGKHVGSVREAVADRITGCLVPAADPPVAVPG